MDDANRGGAGDVSQQTISQFSDAECSDDDGDELDPRVQEELETLNSASGEINTLETELEKSRTKFRTILTESTQKLNAVFKKLGKSVLKARPYYELLKESRQAQSEAQKAAINFQRANSIYMAAKEMVQLAEERNNIPDNEEDKKQFDSAWQEMLNHATIKFMESEKAKTQSEAEHCHKAAQYGAVEQKLRYYEKDMAKSIEKARVYFDLKDRLEKQLQIERVNVEDLQMGLLCAKQKYRTALSNLEAISEEIHQKRRKRLLLPPRTPGVGAESDVSSLPEVSLDNLSDIGSQISVDDKDADSTSLIIASPPNTDPSPPSVRPLTDQCNELKQSGSKRDEVAEGSEMTPLRATLEESPHPCHMPDYHVGAPFLNISHSSDKLADKLHQKLTVDAASPSAASPPLTGDGSRMEKKNRQLKHRSQMEFPILQHLRDNHRQSPDFSGPYGYPTGRPSSRQSSGDSCDVAEKNNKISDEVFV
ncbi:hypothetical protein LSH36_1225g00022 [Paralvinella palmiformis]|uniref:SH3 domain-binding protein 5-like n=1 Tax=Paralvinella palmiformis TaxID=53620 RepID=A0AAD9ITU7_9ANNE|nr:hypothetical protein LSH36_1225g00022 [Paralvinella palmiformis]